MSTTLLVTPWQAKATDAPTRYLQARVQHWVAAAQLAAYWAHEPEAPPCLEATVALASQEEAQRWITLLRPAVTVHDYAAALDAMIAQMTAYRAFVDKHRMAESQTAQHAEMYTWDALQALKARLAEEAPTWQS